MATPFLSSVNSFVSSTLPSPSPSPSPSSSSSYLSSQTTPVKFHTQKNNAKRHLISNEQESHPPSPILTKRSLSVCFMTSFVFSLSNSSSANAAILAADDDEELLEKVKRDRQKRIERQTVLSSASKEKGYLQDVVYKLSKVGQAIENNDLSAANSVLGGSTDSDWVQKANVAFSKLSSSAEEKTQVDKFNASLASLISSVTGNDIESSKIAFVSSATAFEKWTTFTGLVAQLKGL